MAAPTDAQSVLQSLSFVHTVDLHSQVPLAQADKAPGS